MCDSRKKKKCIIIGEVGQAHDGSLGAAHAFIDIIADAGADAVKFQTHIASAESTQHEPWRVKFSYQDTTRYEYWQRMEFTEDQWLGLKEHAQNRGLMFVSSPFSVEAANLLIRIGVDAWKIASGEVLNDPLFQTIIETNLPIILSSGMSTFNEIDDTIKCIKAKTNASLTLMQCTSMYPTPSEYIGLNIISEFQKRYQCGVGLSDHSGNIYAGLAAVTLGAEMLEVHVTLSRQAFGPDVTSSLTSDKLKSLVEGVRFIDDALQNPVDKDEVAKKLESVRQTFMKSVVARTNLPAGTILETSHLTVKKPGTGITAEKLSEVVGQQLLKPLKTDELLTYEHLQ